MKEGEKSIVAQIALLGGARASILAKLKVKRADGFISVLRTSFSGDYPTTSCARAQRPLTLR